jgi:hypothetical protein
LGLREAGERHVVVLGGRNLPRGGPIEAAPMLVDSPMAGDEENHWRLRLDRIGGPRTVEMAVAELAD